jgi:hypothetical protein
VATTVDEMAMTAERDWRAGLSDEQLREVLHLLRLCRYFDERMEALYRQGRLPGGVRRGPTSASRTPCARTTPCSPPTGTSRRSSPRDWTSSG